MFSSPDNLSHYSVRYAAIWLALAFQTGVAHGTRLGIISSFISGSTLG